MALPVWPAGIPYKPDADSLQPFTPFRAPLETEFDGGNVRRRARAGDNVGTIGQTVQMTSAQYDTFIAWVKDTLGNGAGRFRAQVWLGSSYQEKVCQFVGEGPKPGYRGADQIPVQMTLKVYDV